MAELERSGIVFVYSSVLVTPELRVAADPGRGAPETVARRMLEPLGLDLRPVRAGIFAIVRSAPGPQPEAAPPVESTAIEERLEEVAVYASRYRVNPQGVTPGAELSRADIEALPGVEQDVLRVTKYLPGTASNGVSSRPYVRGGRQNELAVYFDGIPLFEPFHFKDFQGLLGVLDPAVVANMDFYSGVLPVRFGDRLSGALDITPRRADENDTWIFGLSPLYVSAVTSGRFDGPGIEWLGAARTSTLGLVLDDLDERVGEPEFADALARLEFPVGGGRAVAGWMLLDDSLDFHAQDETEVAHATYRDATGWLRGEFPLGERWELRPALSHTERHTTRRGSLARDTVTGRVDDMRRHDASTGRLEAVRAGRSSHTFVGIEAASYVSKYEYDGEAQFDPRFAAAFGRPATFIRQRDMQVDGDTYAAYLLYAWDVSRALTLSAGLRYDSQRYEAFRDSQFSPRLLIDWHPSQGWRVRAALGRMHQAERPDELQVQDGEDVFHATQRADQAVLSVEREFGPEWALRVEAFQKRISDPLPIYENLLDSLVPLPELEVDRVRVAPRASKSYGVETSLRWAPAGRWAGWLAYSWTESEDQFAGFERPRTWDQRNAVNTGLSWTRRPWQLSAVAQWRSGWRRTALRLADASTGALELLPRNELAYPNMLSVDLRATWTRPLRASRLHFYADVGNALNRRTPCCTSYALREENGEWQLLRDLDSTFPRYLLLGVNWEIP